MGGMDRSRDPRRIAPYLQDESRWSGGRAEEVVWPECLDDVCDIVASAAAGGSALTISGGGTGVTGGRIPSGGAVLATERLSHLGPVRKLPPDRGALRVGVGVSLQQIQEHVEGSGFFYPPDPTERSAFIGGTLATNASGARSYHYGATRSWVSSLTVVLCDGEILQLERGRVLARDGVFECETQRGGKRRFPAPDWSLPATSKYASGYYGERKMDLIDLLIGSEGTLAVIVEAELRLAPVPEEIVSGVLLFDEESDAFAMIDDLRENGAVRPISLEYFDERALDLMRAQAPFLSERTRAGLLFEQCSSSRDVDSLNDEWLRLAERYRADGASWFAVDAADRRRIRDFRHALPSTVNQRLSRRGVRKFSTDSAVPWEVFPEMLRRSRERLEKAKLEYVAFGHVGDAHLHFNILPRDASEQAAAAEAQHEVAKIACSLGGVMSAEHGIGKIKRKTLAALTQPETLARMREIKTAFDPGWILGPGTLFAP